MKYAALIFTILTLGACSTAPKSQNFLDKLVGQTSLKINEWDDAGSSRTIVTNTFFIQNGGRLLVKDEAPDITLKFVKELGNYVAQYIYYDGLTEKGVRYFTAVGGQIFISEALPDLTPGAPISKKFLDKITELVGTGTGTGIDIDGYPHSISADGKLLTDTSDSRYTFVFDRETGDYSAAYKLFKTTTTATNHIGTKIFTWKNGYYISETVDFGS